MRTKTSFKPIVTIGHNELHLLREGKMYLQPGQWVQLTWTDSPSRWVGVTPGESVWMVHTYRRPDGSLKIDGGASRFNTMCKALRRNRERMAA